MELGGMAPTLKQDLNLAKHDSHSDPGRSECRWGKFQSTCFCYAEPGFS